MREVHKIWYRSVLRDGTTWCTSTNSDEVLKQSIDEEVTYEKAIDYIEQGDWEEWKPGDEG